MEKEKRENIIRVMSMVAEDIENDARNFDGQPFNGKTVGTCFGNQGAAIKAVADAIKTILEN